MKTAHYKNKRIIICAVITVLLCSFSNTVFPQNNYHLIIQMADKDTANKTVTASQKNLLQTSFLNQQSCIEYITRIPTILAGKGYPAASVDSFFYDSAAAHIFLYTGKQYHWVQVNTNGIQKEILEEAGWFQMQKHNSNLDFAQLQSVQNKMLTYYERNGYPFASVHLDSVQIEEDVIHATLKTDRGPLYHIDSIHVYGKEKIKNNFLQKYLSIENGSLYRADKLENISHRLTELPFLQEQQHWDLSMLGTGSVLNLYLQPKRSSEINVLIGFLPGTSQVTKPRLTGDVNLNLKNALGSGESILLNWQKLQQNSPRLDIGYQQPYIFHSPFGVAFNFDLLKRDSAYLQLNFNLGLQYTLSANQSGTVFFQNQRTYLLQGGYDTNQIRITKLLPDNIDVNSSNIGVSYDWINTNYRLNPRKGNELNITGTAGLKKITKNNDIVNLKDPSNPTFVFSSLYDSLKLNSYQLRFLFNVAHYFAAGKKSTVKTSLRSGLFYSQNIFRNELFRIGGYKLLRGFDEESIYATQYAVFTAEYRYFTGINSFLFVFTDDAVTKTNYQFTRFSNSFISAGVGLSFETKVGLLNVSYAVGKRNDVKFDIRESSKIHFGYVNYF